MADRSFTRLSESTRKLAQMGLSGEFGRMMVSVEDLLDAPPDLSGLSPEMRQAQAIVQIAQLAPVRIIPGERIVGSANLKEALHHRVPIDGSYSISHTTLGYHRVLKIGYKGLREQIRSRLQRGDLDEKQIDFLKSMQLCLEAAGIWHQRYLDRLQELVNESLGKEQLHYQTLLDTLRSVPENPPSSFAEAIQSLWFMQAFQHLCGNWSGIGRFDEMLYPYLKKDLDTGRITLDEARELIAHFWIKGTEWIGGGSTLFTNGSGDAQFYQNIILGGIDVNGSEVTNEITYLVLDVVEELRISDYPIAVRLNQHSPEKLLRRIAEVQRLGGGIVAVYQEEVVIDALCRFGYSLEEARSFTNDGCWEALIPGRTAFTYRPEDCLHSLQEILSLNDLSSPLPSFFSFEQLYDAFKRQLVSRIEQIHRETESFGRGQHGCPLVSLFVEDCIERGRGYMDRGPRYTAQALHLGGIADTANSLLAIQKLVYQDQIVSLSELIQILRVNWEDREDLRHIVRKQLECYGNDRDPADQMAKRIYDDYTDTMSRLKKSGEVLFPAGISTFGREIEWRAHRKATADGHYAGEILATNFSPSPGTDREGPTAVLKSYCKMDFTKLPNIGTVELKILPSSVEGQTGIDALVGLLKSFIAMRGCFLHIDVVDSVVLRDAQKHPDRYPNLTVRISGWSARFATLSDDWQEMVINRTQQIVR